MIYFLFLFQEIYDIFPATEKFQPFNTYKIFILSNLKLLVFGLFLLVWPTGFTGIILIIAFLIFELAVYVNYSPTQRRQIAIIFSLLTLNFIPWVILTNEKPFLQVLGKALGKKAGKEILGALTELQEKYPKGFNFLVGSIIAGSISYGTFMEGTTINDNLIDILYLKQAAANYDLVTQRLNDLILLKKNCGPQYLPINFNKEVVELLQEKKEWADIKHAWELKKWW